MRQQGFAFPSQETSESALLFRPLRYIYDSRRKVTQNIAADFEAAAAARLPQIYIPDIYRHKTDDISCIWNQENLRALRKLHGKGF
jgi:hypothetical protein